MKECDNSTRKIRISSNFMLSINLLTTFDTLLLVVICVVRLLFVLLYVLFVCKCVLPPGDNPIAVNRYIKNCPRPCSSQLFASFSQLFSGGFSSVEPTK